MKVWQLLVGFGFVVGYLKTPLSAVKAKVIQGIFTGLGFLVVYGAFILIKQFLRKSDGKLDGH